MINYILDGSIIEPLSKEKPKQAIIFCHGYGGDGKDISVLAINWQRFLPDAIFLCPNAPEICAISPQGFQWFDLVSEKEEIKPLSKYIDSIDLSSLTSINKIRETISQGKVVVI